MQRLRRDGGYDPPVATSGAAAGGRDAERQLGVQYSIARAFAEADSLHDVADQLLATLCEAARFEAAAIWVQGQPDLLRCEAARPIEGRLRAWSTHTKATTFEIGRGLPGRVWESGRPIWVSDTDEEPDFVRRDLAREVGLRHAFAFPVRAHGRVAAVVELMAPSVHHFDAHRSAFLEAISHQLGSLIERLDARTALRESEARKGAVLEAAVDAIVSADEEGQILEFNPAAERLFGYGRTEALGRTISSLLVPPDLREAHINAFARYVRSGKPTILGQRVRTRAARADGTTLPVELTVTEARDEHRRLFTAFIRDISREHEAELARDRFLEILSHELRTPLTAIYGGTKIVGRPSLDVAKRTELLADIAGEADRLHRLVEDLIVLARAERGAHEITLEPVHLDRVVKWVVESVAATSPGVSIRVRSEGPRQPVHGDETYVEQVLRNLLSNASKYGGADGVVQVVIEHDTGETIVRVLDDGQGFGAREAEKLFEIGYRSPLAKATANGSGIGLFAARWLVSAMGGRIWAASRPSGGSEFGFALRAVDAEAEGRGAGPHIVALEP